MSEETYVWFKTLRHELISKELVNYADIKYQTKVNTDDEETFMKILIYVDDKDQEYKLNEFLDKVRLKSFLPLIEVKIKPWLVNKNDIS